MVSGKVSLKLAEYCTKCQQKRPNEVLQCMRQVSPRFMFYIDLSMEKINILRNIAEATRANVSKSRYQLQIRKCANKIL